VALLKTPFNGFHRESNAKLIDFGGWEMPLQYSRIVPEHHQVRNHAGLFDVSHMGELRIRGDRALEVVRHLVTNDVNIEDGQAQYTCMCNERGGVVDDLIVYRVAKDDFLLCVNAANREKDFQWAVSHNPLPGDVTVENHSDDWAQVAIQGRTAQETLQKLTGLSLSDIGYFWFAQGAVAGVSDCIIARTGYTGEDGFEVFIPAADAASVWPAILDAGKDLGVQPIGLGARDTLRLEARLHLYGNDMNDDTTALEAALGWCTKLKTKDDFVGKAALVAQREAGLTKRLVGLVVDKRIPRPHCPILADGEVVGEVTSGTRSPSLEVGIALGYVKRPFTRPGTQLQVDVRGRAADAKVVKGPFYTRPY